MQYVHVNGSFICHFCSKDFKNKYYLRNHVRLVHESVEEGAIFKCTQCSKIFKNNNNLWHHKKAVHGNQIFECALCNALLKSARTLKKHGPKCPNRVNDQVIEKIDFNNSQNEIYLKSKVTLETEDNLQYEEVSIESPTVNDEPLVLEKEPKDFYSYLKIANNQVIEKTESEETKTNIEPEKE